jgi:hypothetical protein
MCVCWPGGCGTRCGGSRGCVGCRWGLEIRWCL